MHHVGRFEDSALGEPVAFRGHHQGYRQAELVNRGTGSVHTGLSMNELAAGGSIDPHVQAFEKGFYILSGEAIAIIDGAAVHLVPGDYAAVKVGTPMAWRTAGAGPVRWLQMAAPQPKPAGAERDTFFLHGGQLFGGLPASDYRALEGPRLGAAEVQGRILGHFDAAMIPPMAARTGAYASTS